MLVRILKSLYEVLRSLLKLIDVSSRGISSFTQSYALLYVTKRNNYLKERSFRLKVAISESPFECAFFNYELNIIILVEKKKLLKDREVNSTKTKLNLNLWKKR